MTTERLLKQRKANKKDFVEKESNFSARVKSRWRLPRGKHSKVRQMHKGRPALPTPGYGAPKAVKGLHPSGLKGIVVNNVKELSNLNTNEGAVLSANLGKKKRLELLKLAQEKKITVLNVGNLAKKIEDLTKEFEGRKTAKKHKLVESGKKEEEKKKKAEEKKQKDEKEVKEHKHDHDHEHKEVEEEKQKEIIEKTITKRQ
jgi:large subunit ribosomal protein L32e